MVKRHIAPIRGKRVCLRLLAEADLAMTLAWRNQDHIRRWFIHSDVISWEQHQRWCAQYFRRDDDFIFIIEETEALCRPVGQLSLYLIAWERRQAEFGRLLIGEPAAIGKGLAKEATQLVLQYGKENLGLEKFILEVMKGNAASIALCLSVGFVPIGERDNRILMEHRK